MKHLGNQVHNHGKNPYEFVEKAEDVEENEEIIDDYMLARDKSRRVNKPPQRFCYADLNFSK